MPSKLISVRGKRSVAAFAAFAVLIAACAAPPAQAPTAPAAQAPAAEAPTTVPAAEAPAEPAALSPDMQGEIVVDNLAGPPTEVMKVMVEAFNKKYPNVKVTSNIQAGDFAEAMYAKGAANNLPDIIFNADLFVPPFVDAGLLVDMEALAKADGSFNIDDIYESILAWARWLQHLVCT